MERKHIVYDSFSDEMVTNRGQDDKLPTSYEWIPKNEKEKGHSAAAHFFTVVFAFLYCRFFLHIRVVGRENLKKAGESGFFVYGNHTQTVGDALIPTYVCRGKRMYTVVSPANLGMPVLGRLLPFMGALPIPGKERMGEFMNAVQTRAEEGAGIVIYPEAHVWPYYTKIRPFEPVSFHYPVYGKKPVFCHTVTYRKRRFGKRPAVTVYLDGPFLPDETKAKKERKRILCGQVRACMEQRAESSTYEYWEYEERK